MRASRLAIVAVLASVIATSVIAAPSAAPTKVAPNQLVVAGRYSDVRFIDMMVPHHLMAIQMARMELTQGHRSPLKQLARSIIASQGREIMQMKAIRKSLTGSATTPTTMSRSQMENMGMVSMSGQMSMQMPFDEMFVDQMIPHHAGAIEMASVALQRSSNTQIQRLARSIVDDQSKEIGKMIAWRISWYGGR